MRVGVVYWRGSDDLSQALAATVQSLGHEAVKVRHDRVVPPGLDALISLGPFASLTPLESRLLAIPEPDRPPFVLWMTEQFWDPRIPGWLGRTAGHVQSHLHRWLMRKNADGRFAPMHGFGWLARRGSRFRYYGDLRRLQRLGLLSALVVSSTWIAEFLSKQGLETTVAHLGSHPEWQATAEHERDIPVIWLGSMGSRRRARHLARLRRALKSRGIDLLVIDRVENPPVYGADRANLLARTKVVVNILRQSWDSNALRYYLAAPNKALIVSEPTLLHTPFINGVHLVETPLDQMADTVCHYLDDAEARSRIAARAYELVTTELTMARGLSQVLRRLPEKGNGHA